MNDTVKRRSEHVQEFLFQEADPLRHAVAEMANADGEERGSVFTKQEVVDFMLDLCGYTSDAALYRKRLLEPSCGDGSFIIRVVERLVASHRSRRSGRATLTDLRDAVRAVEVHHGSLEVVRDRVLNTLRDRDVSRNEAEQLVEAWFIQNDFLLTDFDFEFDVVIGNPPYLRQEQIHNVLLAEYRRRYRTIFDRADLYVPFFERSLSLLTPGGVMSFICADRWTRNRYGGPLRELVDREYRLRAYADLNGTQPFESDVIAYPSISVISKEPRGATAFVQRPDLTPAKLRRLAKILRSGRADSASGVTSSFVTQGRDPWLFDAPADGGGLPVIRDLEAALPTLEEAGCRVGIGVATGADGSFIAPLDELDVEPERKLPLVTTRDIREGVVEWRGLGVLNPFGSDGRVVKLEDWPRFAAFVEARRTAIAGRSVAKRNPNAWFRTIDRIWPELAGKPKLLIPDIKGEGNVVYDDGRFYPHHNLYFVTSESWDLRALQAILRSSVALAFIAAYSTRMRGGYFRFQAQYLRRIRIPLWKDVPVQMRRQLEAAASGTRAECDAVAAEMYGLSVEQAEAFASLRTGGGSNDA